MDQNVITYVALAIGVVLMLPILAPVVERLAAYLAGLRLPKDAATSPAACPDTKTERDVFADLADVGHALVKAGHPPDVVKKLIDPLVQMVIDFKKGSNS